MEIVSHLIKILSCKLHRIIAKLLLSVNAPISYMVRVFSEDGEFYAVTNVGVVNPIKRKQAIDKIKDIFQRQDIDIDLDSVKDLEKLEQIAGEHFMQGLEDLASYYVAIDVWDSNNRLTGQIISWESIRDDEYAEKFTHLLYTMRDMPLSSLLNLKKPDMQVVSERTPQRYKDFADFHLGIVIKKIKKFRKTRRVL